MAVMVSNVWGCIGTVIPLSRTNVAPAVAPAPTSALLDRPSTSADVPPTVSASRDADVVARADRSPAGATWARAVVVPSAVDALPSPGSGTADPFTRPLPLAVPGES